MRERSAPGPNRPLEAIGATIEWTPLAALAARLRPGRTGRPPYEPLVMLKALLLQRLDALTDTQLDEALLRSAVVPALRRLCGRRRRGRRDDSVPLPPDAAESGVLEACLA